MNFNPFGEEIAASLSITGAVVATIGLGGLACVVLWPRRKRTPHSFYNQGPPQLRGSAALHSDGTVSFSRPADFDPRLDDAFVRMVMEPNRAASFDGLIQAAEKAHAETVAVPRYFVPPAKSKAKGHSLWRVHGRRDDGVTYPIPEPRYTRRSSALRAARRLNTKAALPAYHPSWGFLYDPRFQVMGWPRPTDQQTLVLDTHLRKVVSKHATMQEAVAAGRALNNG